MTAASKTHGAAADFGLSHVTVEDIEVFTENLDPKRAASIYQEHGCLVVRGLMKPYLAAIQRDIEAGAQQSIALLNEAQQIAEGWVTPDGTLFIPAPDHSQAPRPVFINRYRRADDYVVIGAATVEKRAEAEKHAAEAKKENQRGLMVRGSRPYVREPQ